MSLPAGRPIAHGPRLFINAHSLRGKLQPAPCMTFTGHADRKKTIRFLPWSPATYTMPRRLGQLRPFIIRRFADAFKARFFSPGDRGFLPDRPRRTQPRPRAACAGKRQYRFLIPACAWPCTGCVDICPENLIRLTGLGRCLQKQAKAAGMDGPAWLLPSAARKELEQVHQGAA